MSKNIIICADGTGNSGGTGEVTNVWRLYEAIALQDPDQEQVAKHDDGVGTQSLKFIRILGMGVGLGLSSNLAELYHYLIRRYDEGDRIYLFGFSRGAFTVRTLANILYFCGIADRHDSNGDLLSPEELDDLSAQAVAAHQTRNWQDPDAPWSDAFKFRTKYGLVHQGVTDGDVSEYQKHCKGRFPIEFVGVWDTVDAVGLPFDEMTQFCLRKVEKGKRVAGIIPLEKLFGHVLRRTSQTYNEGNGWEDDAGHVLKNVASSTSGTGGSSPDGTLQPFIRRIFHAISIDDERYTFHPTMFLENGDAKTKAGAVIEQVWFSGVHANVGGGYPKDGLACVPLCWMMHHAERAGLKFNADTWRSYRQLADADGPLFDSRAGVGRFYRYRPRKLGQLCQDAGIEKPKLHPSVLTRLESRVQDYAPTAIPAEYAVAEAPECERSPQLREDDGDAEKRMSVQKHASELIWWRRVVYYCFVLWIVLWLGVNFASESILELIANCVRSLDSLGFNKLTEAWYVFAGLAFFLALFFNWRGSVVAKSDEGKVVHRLRREFLLISMRNLCLGTLGILVLHEPLTLLLDWSLPAMLSPLVELLQLSPVVLLVLFGGSYVLQRSSVALIEAIGTTQSAAWDASLLRKKPLSIAQRGLPIRWLYRTAEKRLSHQRDKGVLLWKWKAGPFCVFWLVILFALGGMLTSAASVALRFQTASERFAHTSDSLSALASVYPHGRIEFDRIEDVDFDTSKASLSSTSLTKGSYYLVLAVPTDWSELSSSNDQWKSGELPYKLSGRHSGTDVMSSSEAAEFWGWKDCQIPATPEGNVEREMNLATRLVMKLAAPFRRSAALPWFQLMGHMQQAEDLLIPIGSSVIFQAPADGKLKLYVNDVPQFYCNNSGTARIRIYKCRVAD